MKALSEFPRQDQVIVTSFRGMHPRHVITRTASSIKDSDAVADAYVGASRSVCEMRNKSDGEREKAAEILARRAPLSGVDEAEATRSSRWGLVHEA